MAAVVTAKGTATGRAIAGTTLTLASVAISDGASVLVSILYLNTSVTLTGITWNGASLTQVATKVGTNCTCDIWALHGATGGTGSVVATFDATGATAAMAVDQVIGLSTSPTDKTASATATSTSPSSGATATTTQANELWFGAVGTNGPVGDTAGSWSNSFTADQRDGTTGGVAATNVTISTGYRVVTSTGAATAAKTGITSREWEACVATFKSAADQSASLGTASSASADPAPTSTPGTASVSAGTAAPASAGRLPSSSGGAVSVALASGTHSSACPTASVTGDPNTAALGTCEVESDVPDHVPANVLDNQAAAVQAIDPPTTQFDPDPGRVNNASSSGVRSKGDPYFAMWMQDLDGFTDIGGGECTAEMIFALHSKPAAYASPSEPHWLFSFHEVAGSELFSIGVTPDLRLCAVTYGRPVLVTAPGIIQPDSAIHDLQLFSPGGGGRSLYLDGVRVAQDFIDNGAEIGVFSPNHRTCRVMLFNGVAGTTKCTCSIFAAGFYTENDNIVWPLSESTGVLAHGYESNGVVGVPVVPPTDLNFPAVDWALTADWFDPFPNPRTWPFSSTADIRSEFKWLRGTKYRAVSIVTPTYTESVAGGGPPFAPVEEP